MEKWFAGTHYYLEFIIEFITESFIVHKVSD